MEFEKIDFNSFMNNDNDPYLTKMANKLLQDPTFIKILKDNGIDIEDEDE